MEEQKASRIEESMEEHGKSSYYYSTSLKHEANLRIPYSATGEPVYTSTAEVHFEPQVIKPVTKYGFLNEEKFVRVYVEFDRELDPANVKFALQPQSFTLDHIVSPTEIHRLYLVE